MYRTTSPTARTNQTSRRRTATRLITGLAASSFLFAACSSDPAPLALAPTDSDVPAAVDQGATSAGVAATIGTSDLGEILVGSNGLSLYGFTNDTQAASTCYGTCADAWPPVIVSENFALAPALDTGIFATTVRDDGQLQLVAGKWPLYFFAGDTVPGDINGQESGDVWFLVDTDGKLIDGIAASGDAATDSPAVDTAAGDEAAASPVAVGSTDAGSVLVDSEGLSLYGFTNDVDGVPTCDGACADAWPPLTVASADLPADLDPNVFSVVERTDGSFQLKAGDWPLYRFAGDGAPGDTNGQNSGDVWFLSAPDGSLIKGDQATASTGDSGTESSGY